MPKTTMDLPEALHRTLRIKAAVEGCSMNEIMTAALRSYLRDFRLDPGCSRARASLTRPIIRAAPGPSRSPTPSTHSTSTRVEMPWAAILCAG